MSLNIEMNMKTSSGYEVMYPKTLGSNVSGAVSSANTLSTARTIRTNLASTSTASFNGGSNITPGVTGTLGVNNGGTGVTSYDGLKDALKYTINYDDGLIASCFNYVSTGTTNIVYIKPELYNEEYIKPWSNIVVEAIAKNVTFNGVTGEMNIKKSFDFIPSCFIKKSDNTCVYMNSSPIISFNSWAVSGGNNQPPEPGYWFRIWDKDTPVFKSGTKISLLAYELKIY